LRAVDEFSELQIESILDGGGKSIYKEHGGKHPGAKYSTTSIYALKESFCSLFGAIVQTGLGSEYNRLFSIYTKVKGMSIGFLLKLIYLF
jgi:hypothetical protein